MEFITVYWYVVVLVVLVVAGVLYFALKPKDQLEEPVKVEPVIEPVKKVEPQAVVKPEVQVEKPVEKVEEPVEKAEKVEPVNEPVKPVVDEAPKAEPKKEAPVKEAKAVKYHVSQNKDENSESFKKWRVRKEGSEKTIKFFDTQKEAIDYAEELALNAGSSVVIHKVDGSIRKQDYTKKEEPKA